MRYEELVKALKEDEEWKRKIDDDVWEKIKPRKSNKKNFHCELGALD